MNNASFIHHFDKLTNHLNFNLHIKQHLSLRDLYKIFILIAVEAAIKILFLDKPMQHKSTGKSVDHIDHYI